MQQQYTKLQNRLWVFDRTTNAHGPTLLCEISVDRLNPALKKVPGTFDGSI